MNMIDVTKLKASDIAVIGMPFDDHSSYMQGSAQAPQSIREMVACESGNYFSELGIDFYQHPNIIDLGDLSWKSIPEAYKELETTVSAVIAQSAKSFVLGGDHSITYPILKGVAQHVPNVTILHIDAHSDLYDSLDNNPLSHASPFARIMEDGLAGRLVQLGVRTLTDHQREQADKFNVEIHEMKDWQGSEQFSLTEPIYLSFDMDSLDPAFAPGVSHHEPGGFSTRQVIDIIHSINVPIVGADIVEYNPIRDINGVTAMVAAKIYKEICSMMLRNV